MANLSKGNARLMFIYTMLLGSLVLPFFVSVFAYTFMLWVVLHKDTPQTVDITLLKPASKTIKSKKFFKISWLFLMFLMSGYFLSDILNLPLSIFALSGALVFMILGTKFGVLKPTEVIK